MSSIATVNAADAESGDMGQRYLVAGDSVALRMWHEESPSEAGEAHVRDYETVGYVVSGSVELTADGEKLTLSAGDSWHVPKGATRSYRIVETLTAIEATAPPARDAGDAPAS